MSSCLTVSPLISLRAATKQVERILSHKEQLVIGFSGGLQLIADDFDETVAKVSTLARRIDDAIGDGLDAPDPDAVLIERIRREIAEGWIHDGDSLRRVASAEMEATRPAPDQDHDGLWHSFTLPMGHGGDCSCDSCLCRALACIGDDAIHARNCTSLDGGAA